MDDGQSLLERLTAPLKILALAMAIAIGDQLHTRLSGNAFSVGPFRPFWLAAGLVGIAVVLAAARILSND